MSGGKRTNGVVLSSHSILDFLSGLKEMNGCGYLHYAYMELFVFFSSTETF